MNAQRWRQIKQIYGSVLEREPERREAFLDEACAGDETLRKEVASLLAQEGRSERLFDSPALDAAAKALAKDEAQTPAPDLTGQTLSHYRILEKIGEGGMGMVYRAEDTHLSRQVAIKVLPDTFLKDPERLARFEREAKLLALLNHPNIAAIYGLERTESTPLLIMELVEGQTLAERLAKGPLPVAEALKVSRQLAEGLEAAHERGIVHRDLKPANVKITPEGQAKILDFGLAKALQSEPDLPEHSPEISEVETRTGVILGTAAYMSPEQANGRAVDKRADIWAFGCILFECMTGKRALEGDTVTETLAAILKGEPDWNLLPAATPWRTKDLLHRCLQKDPRERLHDIGDARIEIEESVSEPPQVTPTAQRFPLRWVLSISTATLLIGVLTGLAMMRYFRPPASPSQPVIRTSIRLGPGQWLDGMRLSRVDRPTRTGMALSGDGRFVVYSAIKENPTPRDQPCLYLRRLDQLEGKPIAGTEGGSSPFLSPDDRWIGFWADGKLKKVSVDGGVALGLCDVPLPFGFSWGADNQIVFGRGTASGLSRISAEGGKPEALTAPDRAKDEHSHRLPHCLPEGKGLLFTIFRDYVDMQPRVAVLEPDTRKRRVLLEDAADARYLATGHLAFLRHGTLMLVPFDADKLQTTGEAFPVVENVAQALNTLQWGSDTAAGQFSISASGSLIFAPGGIVPDAENSLVWVDHKGNAEPITHLKAPFFAPRLAPNGQRIAYRTMGKRHQVWVYDLNRDTNTNLTSEGLANWVTWNPDSKRLVFGWSKAGVSNLYWQAVDRSSPMEPLTSRSECNQFAGSWSPDGEMLAFLQRDREAPFEILIINVRDRTVKPFLNSPFNETYPEFSPDGRWIAYGSDESGRPEVYVKSSSRSGGKYQVSGEGGREPLWSRNGKQLYYRYIPDAGLGTQVWGVDVRAEPAFSMSKPRLLFEHPGYVVTGPIRGWDISLDGTRFLMVKSGENRRQPVTEMILVQNWFEEVKRLVPAK